MSSLFFIEFYVTIVCQSVMSHVLVLNTTVVHWHVRALFCVGHLCSKFLFLIFSRPFILLMISSSVKCSNVGSLTSQLNHKQMSFSSTSWYISQILINIYWISHRFHLFIEIKEIFHNWHDFPQWFHESTRV